jgi:DNA-directed RNA polymerase specialized sigma subunit
MGRKRNPNKKNYVDPDEFRDEIIKSKEKDKLTSRAVEMLVLMCNHVSRINSYKYPMDREDCIAFAIEDVLRYWRGYDPEKSTYAFAYFTRMIINGLQKGWKKLYPIKSINKVSLSHENIFNI